MNFRLVRQWSTEVETYTLGETRDKLWAENSELESWNLGSLRKFPSCLSIELLSWIVHARWNSARNSELASWKLGTHREFPASSSIELRSWIVHARNNSELWLENPNLNRKNSAHFGNFLLPIEFRSWIVHARYNSRVGIMARVVVVVVGCGEMTMSHVRVVCVRSFHLREKNKLKIVTLSQSTLAGKIKRTLGKFDVSLFELL